MKELIKMASVEAFKNNKSAGSYISRVSENLHDILLYLDTNKADLPTKSEISVIELFELLNTAVKDIDTIELKIDNNDKWLNALACA